MNSDITMSLWDIDKRISNLNSSEIAEDLKSFSNCVFSAEFINTNECK